MRLRVLLLQARTPEDPMAAHEHAWSPHPALALLHLSRTPRLGDPGARQGRTPLGGDAHVLGRGERLRLRARSLEEGVDLGLGPAQALDPVGCAGRVPSLSSSTGYP